MAFTQRCSLSGAIATPSARAVAFKSSFHGAKVGSFTSQPSRRTSVVRGVFASNPVADVGKYLADAAKQIFSPATTGDEPPWSGSGSPFSGGISHHESADRLRAMYQAVRSTREAITGCTDPDATNYDPAAIVDDGTCNFVANTTEETGMTEDLRSYVTGTLARVWGNNFKGDDTEPKDWGNLGYSYRGQRVSQRDISRLLQYEKVVKKALEEAEASEKK